jgi:cell division FtsZ-interacting protein ZapD
VHIYKGTQYIFNMHNVLVRISIILFQNHIKLIIIRVHFIDRKKILKVDHKLDYQVYQNVIGDKKNFWCKFEKKMTQFV